ncbi:MAG: sulfotransferase domain-containing protein [Pseudomonadota bacterium]
MTEAPLLKPTSQSYRGTVTDPELWSRWSPRVGDVIVCTPAKCGTTWTQTIVAMLLNGGPKLGGKVPVLSPWVDGDLGVPSEQVIADLAQQTGRRVVKTHTPPDGFPLWGGVSMVAVYRHPLDVFFSLRKHTENQVSADEDHPMKRPVSESLRDYVERPGDVDNIDSDVLETFVWHYSETVRSGRWSALTLLHYNDMLRAPRKCVSKLAKALAVDADEETIDEITKATSFGAMKARAADFAPVAGTGFWKSDKSFFDAGSTGKWADKLSTADVARFRARWAALLPDSEARRWIEQGAR